MPATVTFDHYEVLTRDDGSLYELGRGAMGVTYKAFDTNLRIPVALKVINTRLLNSDVARQRFIREARSAAKLRHRHVASVFHLGTDSDTYFYAMEFIDGETVESLIKRTGPQPALTALKIALQVTRALSAAEQHGLVHRDIKPANLMLVREDDELCVKVIDFGLVKAMEGELEEEAGAALSMGGFFGTPHFASPEQLLEKPIDIRSDLYSLGATLWYVLAGHAPFGGSMAEVMGGHISNPPPIENLGPISPALQSLLRRMLAKNPDDRPQTAAALRQEIEQCIEKVAGGPVAPAARAATDEQPHSTVLGDSAARASHASFSPGTKVGGRYEILRELGESNAGAQFHARDQSQCDLRLVALNRRLLSAPAVFARIQHDADHLRAVDHRNLLRIYGVEIVNGEGVLLLEWTNGFTLLDLLRARRELPAAEVLPLLDQIAAGVDFALVNGVHRLDLGLHQILVHFPDAVDPQRDFVRLETHHWPQAVVKINPLDVTREQPMAETWTGGRTVAGSVAGGSRSAGSPAAGALLALSRVVYELLGGAFPAIVAPGSLPRYAPLSSLSEAGNAVLKRAFDPAETFGSASEFAAALRNPGSAPASPGFPPKRPKGGIALPPPPAPVQPTSVSSSAPPKPVPAAGPTAEPKAPPTRVQVRPEKKGGGAALVGGGVAALVAAAGAAYFIAPHFLGGAHGSGQALSTPAPTPAYTANRDQPATPPPETTPAPGPSRRDQLTAAVAEAEAIQKKEDLATSVATWNHVAREFHEDGIGKMRLELLLNSVRYNEVKFSDAEKARLHGPLTEAANLQVVGAMMLLGTIEREYAPAKAFYWFSTAAEKNQPAAVTEVGLMLSNGLGTARDLPKAVEKFQQAMDLGDSAAAGLLGECYLLGKGVAKDEKRAVELLQTAAQKNDPHALDLLADCYVHGEGVTRNPAESFRLYSQARSLGSQDALGNLGVLYIKGDGVAQDQAKAVQLFQEGAGKGNATCMFFLAQCLESGTGTVADPLEAAAWYKKAADLGNRRAVEWRRQNGKGP